MAVGLQARDIDIMLALWRFDFLTMSQIGAVWWTGRDASRPRDRLARLAEVGLLRRCRPLVRRGTHEWIYSLARGGFDRLRDDQAVDVTHDTRFSERRVHMHRVERVLRINEWLLAYARLTGHSLTDWRGSREAQPVGADALRVDGIAPGPVSPDAAAVLRDGDDVPAFALLVEFLQQERPGRLAERLQRHAFLIGSQAQSAPCLPSGEPVRGAILVAPTLAAVEQLVRTADGELSAGAVDGACTARTRIMFCAQSDAGRGSRRAWMLPVEPPEQRGSPAFVAREVSLPGKPTTATAT